MSAPPLPETFGNYALGDFAEVASPAAINWLPQTQGWLWLGLILLVLLGRYGWKQLRHWYRNRYRREAATRLQQLADKTDQGGLLTELNRLLKLTALAAFPREQVASLSGDAWVTFLNGQCSSPPFSAAQGQLLALGTYQTAAVEVDAWQTLVASSLTWVQEHENGQHV